MRIRPRFRWQTADHAEALLRGVSRLGIPKRRRIGGPSGPEPAVTHRERLWDLRKPLSNWLKRADVEYEHRPGVTDKQSAWVRELKERNRLPEHENKVLR